MVPAGSMNNALPYRAYAGATDSFSIVFAEREMTSMVKFTRVLATVATVAASAIAAGSLVACSSG